MLRHVGRSIRQLALFTLLAFGSAGGASSALAAPAAGPLSVGPAPPVGRPVSGENVALGLPWLPLAVVPRERPDCDCPASVDGRDRARLELDRQWSNGDFFMLGTSY